MTNLMLDSTLLKAEASRLGFTACGTAPVAQVDEDTACHFLSWIEQGKHASMEYLAKNIDKRLNPGLLVEGAQSIISVALNYHPSKLLDPTAQYEFATYAYGQDYHEVMKSRLTALLNCLHSMLPEGHPRQARIFCDTAPLLEKYWAWRCGLGWIGKNTQLIIPQAGSAFFLGEIIIDVPFSQYDSPMDEQCGNCTRCLDECPTQALYAPYRLDSAQCLSYQTIENRGEIPAEIACKMGNCIYGCDRCRTICPWHRFASPTQVAEFAPTEAFLSLTRAELEALTPDKYRTIFKKTAIKRAKYEGLMRNIRYAKGE